MGTFFWYYYLDYKFPFGIIEFTTRGNVDRLHWHDYLQIALCTGGKGKFIFTNKEYNVSEGDIFIISNFENHVAVSIPPNIINFIFVIFLPIFIAPPGSRQFDFEYLSPFWYNSETFDNKIDHNATIASEIYTMIKELKQIWDKKEIGYKHLIDSNLRRILAILIKYYKTVDPQYYLDNMYGQVHIKEALDYINNNYKNNITLADVSEKLHVGESRFRHLFKEKVHMSFKEYVTYLRLAESRKLLYSTDMNIYDIACNVGYTNIHQFYKVFEKYLNMTPAEYRKYSRSENIN